MLVVRPPPCTIVTVPSEFWIADAPIAAAPESVGPSENTLVSGS